MPFIPAFYGTCEDGTGGPNNASGGGGGGSAPTGVSIATSSSGNYNNAIIANNTLLFVDMIENGSNFSSNACAKTIDLGELSQANSGNAASVTIQISGYIRATGATSFQWGLEKDLVQTSLTSGSFEVGGTASTNQDVTSGHIGRTATLTFGSFKGSPVYPSSGDVISMIISGTATNSNGSTNATSLTLKYTFSS